MLLYTLRPDTLDVDVELVPMNVPKEDIHLMLYTLIKLLYCLFDLRTRCNFFLLIKPRHPARFPESFICVFPSLLPDRDVILRVAGIHVVKGFAVDWWRAFHYCCGTLGAFGGV